MKIELFNKLLENKIIILDGATGTELQKRGLPTGVCPEKWVIENPDILIEVQSEYIKNGSNIVYTCTFGANRIKLKEFGFENETFEINKKSAELSRQAAGTEKFVAGDIAPTGLLVEPSGDFLFEEAVQVYKEQIKGLLAGGVDLLVIETMMDIQEARAALIAAKEETDIPVCVTMTFSDDQKTLTGTDPVTALITLQSLGADAFGCNCSAGPAEILELIKILYPFAKIPLIAKPNAGLPKMKDGKTYFDMGPEEFAGFTEKFVKYGVNLFGGCCGTSPEFIKCIKDQLNIVDVDVCIQKEINYTAVTSSRKTVFINTSKPLTIIGESINPTGRPKLQEELKRNELTEVKKLAFKQTYNGAEILDINVGMYGIDELQIMKNIINGLSVVVETPLCIDSSNPDVIEQTLRLYPGRALLNSISGETEKLAKLLPVAKKYGAVFIALPLDDNGIPKDSAGRIEIINKLIEEADKKNISTNNIIVDGLIMSVSSNQNLAKETLKVIKYCRDRFKVNTVVGLSNISFGLPNRNLINSAFLAMAAFNGLSSVIANPSDELVKGIKLASDVLLVRDISSTQFLKQFSDSDKIKTDTSTKELPLEKQIYNSVVVGDKDNIINLLSKLISEQKYSPMEIVNKFLIPAITEVGDLYDKKQYFLPQLILSAETMKKGFAYIEPYLKKDKESSKLKPKKIILATVKGDIHDIGKNIVGLILRNYGYNIVDMGKDVKTEDIIEFSNKNEVDIIGLSALMTTTMYEMKKTVEQIKKSSVKSKIMVGGAVVTQDFADDIGADGYAYDAIQAVKLVKNLID